MQKTSSVNPDRLLDHALITWLHGHWIIAVIVGGMVVIEQGWSLSRGQRRRYC